MKTLAVAALCALSLPLHASVKNYINSDNCTLEVRETENASVYTLEKDSKKEVVSFYDGFMSVDFAYCPNRSGEIYMTEGSAGYGAMVFCDEDEKAVQRGVVDLEVRNSGVVNSFSVISEVKVKGEWIKNKSLSCSGFQLVNE